MSQKKKKDKVYLGSFLETITSNKKAFAFLEKIYWSDGPQCPYCESKCHTAVKDKANKYVKYSYHCNSCNSNYRVTVGTMFHGTRVKLRIWFYIMSHMLWSKHGIAIEELHRHLRVRRSVIRRIVDKIRMQMKEDITILDKIIKADEMWEGSKRKRKQKNGIQEYDHSGGRGKKTLKTPIIGFCGDDKLVIES